MGRRTWLTAVTVLALAAVAWVLVETDGFGVLAADSRNGASDVGAPEQADRAFEEEARGAAARLQGVPGVHLAQHGAGSITGKVHLLVEGVGEKPLPGAAIEALSIVRGTEKRAEGVTDDEGAFTLAPVGVGAGWVLRAKHPGHRDQVVRAVAVHEGLPTDVGTLVFGAATTLTGGVTDAAGRPLGNAQISVLRDGVHGVQVDLARALRALVASPGSLADAKSGPDGRFAVQGLPPGTYQLRVSAPGFASVFRRGVVVTADGQSADVRVTLDPGAGYEGRVLDETGRGIPDAEVVAVALRSEHVETIDRHDARSDSDGRYRIDSMTPGTMYFLEAHAVNFAPYGRVVTPQGVTHLDLPLVVGGRIEGHVTDARTHAAVPGAEVMALTGLVGGGTAPVAALADERGAYALEHVIPGPLVLMEVRAQGYGPGGMGFDAHAGRTIPPGGTLVVDVALDLGGRVLGTVRTEDGRPVPYASVAAILDRERWRGETHVLSDAHGEYRLLGLKPGDWILTLTAAGYASPTADAEVKVTVTPDGQDLRRDFVLKSGGTVEGIVKSPGDDKGVSGARVALVPQGPPNLVSRVRDLSTVTDASGAYRISGAPSGMDLLVEASHDAFVATSTTAFRVAGEETKTVDVVLKVGAKLIGRAVDARGRGAGGARIRFGHVPPEDVGALRDSFRADQLLSPRVFVADADGRFVIDRVPPGLTLLTIEADGFAPWRKKDMQVPEEGNLDGITATLEGAMTIAGRVLADATGRPIGGAWVVALAKVEDKATADAGRVRTVVSCEAAADGTYLLERVPPGPFDVVVWLALGYATGDKAPESRREGTPAGATGVEFRLKPVAPPTSPGN